MTNYQTGKDAEQAAVDYLQSAGYRVRGRNWKTRLCEIDIIAEKDSCLYFVEVKYRKNTKQGSGFDYITPKKQQQMQFAADLYMQQENWNGDCTLAAMELSGDPPRVQEFIDSL